MQSKASTIAAYLEELSPPERSVIATLDQLLRSRLPKAVGTMKYGMPTYEADGRAVVAINAQKNYFSFYADPELVQKHRAALGDLDIGKSCIRFRRLDPTLLASLKRLIDDHAK